MFKDVQAPPPNACHSPRHGGSPHRQRQAIPPILMAHETSPRSPPPPRKPSPTSATMHTAARNDHEAGGQSDADVESKTVTRACADEGTSKHLRVTTRGEPSRLRSGAARDGGGRKQRERGGRVEDARLLYVFRAWLTGCCQIWVCQPREILCLTSEFGHTRSGEVRRGLFRTFLVREEWRRPAGAGLALID